MFAQQGAPSSEGTGGWQFVVKMLKIELGLHLLPHRPAAFQTLELERLLCLKDSGGVRPTSRYAGGSNSAVSDRYLAVVSCGSIL